MRAASRRRAKPSGIAGAPHVDREPAPVDRARGGRASSRCAAISRAGRALSRRRGAVRARARGAALADPRAARGHRAGRRAARAHGDRCGSCARCGPGVRSCTDAVGPVRLRAACGVRGGRFPAGLDERSRGPARARGRARPSRDRASASPLGRALERLLRAREAEVRPYRPHPRGRARGAPRRCRRRTRDSSRAPRSRAAACARSRARTRSGRSRSERELEALLAERGCR